MKIKYVDLVCGNCDFVNEVPVSESNQTELSLKAYKEYKDRPVYRCDNCDYCSYDLTQFDSKAQKIIESQEYIDTINYEELEGLTELWTPFIESYNAYDYKCASMIYEKLGDYDNAFVSLFRCVELKEALKRRYNFMYLEDKEDLDDDEIADFKRLDNILYDSAEQDLDHMLHMFADVTKNDFNRIIYIEVLSRFEEYDLVKKVASQMTLPKDIKDYIKSLKD